MVHIMRKSHNRWTTNDQFWARSNQRISHLTMGLNCMNRMWWFDIILFFLHSRLDWFIFRCFIDINKYRESCLYIVPVINLHYVKIYRFISIAKNYPASPKKKKNKNKGDNKRFNMTFNKEYFFLIKIHRK